jgi:5-methylcytosine-specific restriction protein A
MSPRFTGFPPEIKATIRSRAQAICERCGQYSSDCVAHHRRPRSMGGSRRDGTNAVSNGLWLCSMCHNFVESHRSLAYENGWLVKQSADPALIPVLRRGVFVLLQDDGSFIREAA